MRRVDVYALTTADVRRLGRALRRLQALDASTSGAISEAFRAAHADAVVEAVIAEDARQESLS